jgi:hypothetical protein
MQPVFVAENLDITALSANTEKSHARLIEAQGKKKG